MELNVAGRLGIWASGAVDDRVLAALEITPATAVENDIISNKTKSPLTASGDVGWGTAQSAPDHLRLTLVNRLKVYQDHGLLFGLLNLVQLQVTQLLMT